MTRNLLILDQFTQLGGAQRCLLDLLPAFLEAGYATHVAVPGDGPLAGWRARLQRQRCIEFLAVRTLPDARAGSMLLDSVWIFRDSFCASRLWFRNTASI